MELANMDLHYFPKLYKYAFSKHRIKFTGFTAIDITVYGQYDRMTGKIYLHIFKAYDEFC